ncbi:hypothetical protein bcere0028_45700 [Bacillus cereus AH1271]|nr:hypothetical protein bcere0028_45700 [Bacillus cereus AH1271]
MNIRQNSIFYTANLNILSENKEKNEYFLKNNKEILVFRRNDKE